MAGINVENMTIEKRILLLNHNYDICKILDNTVLGVFIGLISGIGISLMNQDNSCGKFIFIIGCGVSICFIIIAMRINSKFIEDCKKSILSRKRRAEISDIIADVVSNDKQIKHRFFISFGLSLFFFGIGLTLSIILNTDKVPNSNEYFYQPNDSIQKTYHQEYILNFDTLKLQHKQQSKIDSTHNNKIDAVIEQNKKIIENQNKIKSNK